MAPFYREKPDEYEEKTSPRISLPLRSPRPACTDVRELELGRRGLREAVLLLAMKVEALGVDVSEVTEMLGVFECDPGLRPQKNPRLDDVLGLADRKSLDDD